MSLNDYQELINIKVMIYKDRDIAILAVGGMVRTAEDVARKLKEQGKKVTLVNVRFVSPFDKELLDQLSIEHSLFVTMEENIRSGGFGQQVSDYLCDRDLRQVRHLNISIPDQFVEHGSIEELHKLLGLDSDAILRRILIKYKN